MLKLIPGWAYALIIFIQTALLSPNSFTMVMLGTGLFLLKKSDRVIYVLICLEVLSMLALFMVLANLSFWTTWQLSGALLILVCLVLEASMGLALLVTTIRWRGKAKILTD